MHFTIECGKRGAVLDPKATYLKIKLNKKMRPPLLHSNNLIVDVSAHSVINLLEVYYGSQ